MPEQSPQIDGREFKGSLIRTSDMTAADFVIAASQIEYIESDPLEVLKTDQDVLEQLWVEVQEKYWFMRPEYRRTEPKEQWTLIVGTEIIALYNYSEKIMLSNEKVASIALNIGRFAATFPNLYPGVEVVTIVDKPYEDPLEDDMAEAFPRAQMFVLNSYALEEGMYRPDLPIARLDAVILHELAHFGMDEQLEEEWENAGFFWDKVVYSEKLQQKANKPDTCVTDYAVRGGVYEDIAESAVAYMLSGSKLDTTKKELIARYDNWRRIPEITYKKEQEIIVPELPPELTFYVDSDATDNELENE